VDPEEVVDPVDAVDTPDDVDSIDSVDSADPVVWSSVGSWGERKDPEDEAGSEEVAEPEPESDVLEAEEAESSAWVENGRMKRSERTLAKRKRRRFI
jgi:hypothetical protein